MDDRGRLTIPDFAYLLISLGVLAVLSPVFFDVLDRHAYAMNTGTVYLIQLVVPLAILVVFTIVYLAAVGGEV